MRTRSRSHRVSLWWLLAAVLGVATLVLGGVTGWAVLHQGDADPAPPQVGDCVRLVASRGAVPGGDGSLPVGLIPADCAVGPTPMTYLVGTAVRGDGGCPSNDHLEYAEPSAHSRAAGERAWTACLVPNFRSGLCYGDDASTLGFQVVPCGIDALFKVEQIGRAAETRCGEGSRLVSYPELDRSACLRPPS